MTDPYADHARTYLANGWSPIPVPYRRKDPIPVGVTGNWGEYVNEGMIKNWLANGWEVKGKPVPRPWNIALRLPDTVIGIDVDHYESAKGDKTGGDTLAAREAELGALPPTWRSSSRHNDLLSGIRFFRVPAKRKWKGLVAGGSVETVSHHHRFALIWPSIHPDTEKPYAWTDPDGFPTDEIPSIDDLPDLPPAWVEYLDLGDFAENTDPQAFLQSSDAWDWLTTYAEKGDPCGVVKDRLEKYTAALKADGASHHDVALRGVNALVRHAEEGHRGVLPALDDLRSVFFETAGREDHAEWGRMVVGGVAKVLARRTGFDDRGCCPEEDAEIADLNVDEEHPEQEPGETWRVVDLEDVLNGDYVRPQPAVGCYGDSALFYPGKVNGIAGESGAGKSWVALVACAQEIRVGQHVIYIDFEDDVAGVVDRLLSAGTSPEDVREFFHYIRPHERLGDAGAAHLLDAVRTFMPTLVVVDSTGESMAIEGVNANDDGEVADWMRKFPSALARRGPAVLLLDHTTKTDGGLWPIGSQRKRAAITAQYILRIDQPYDRQTSGGSNIICAKDRHGNYSYARLVARLSVSNEEDTLSVDLVSVDSDADGDRSLSALERRILMYVDERMREIHGQLDDEDEIMEGRPTYTKIREDVVGGVGEVKRAILRLVERNLLIPVEVKTGKRRTTTLYEPGVRDFDIEED